jgi:hypothetical protein
MEAPQLRRDPRPFAAKLGASPALPKPAATSPTSHGRARTPRPTSSVPPLNMRGSLIEMLAQLEAEPMGNESRESEGLA